VASKPVLSSDMSHVVHGVASAGLSSAAKARAKQAPSVEQSTVRVYGSSSQDAFDRARWWSAGPSSPLARRTPRTLSPPARRTPRTRSPARPSRRQPPTGRGGTRLPAWGHVGVSYEDSPRMEFGLRRPLFPGSDVIDGNRTGAGAAVTHHSARLCPHPFGWLRAYERPLPQDRRRGRTVTVTTAWRASVSPPSGCARQTAYRPHVELEVFTLLRAEIRSPHRNARRRWRRGSDQVWTPTPSWSLSRPPG
jgi:hypothetical protein